MKKNILNKILENHLFLEFSMHGNTLEGVQIITEGYGFLLEKYGVIPNLGTYTHTALNYFKPQIKGVKDKKIIHLTENICNLFLNHVHNLVYKMNSPVEHHSAALSLFCSPAGRHTS